MENKIKADTEVLFPGVEVEGYKVKPWRFGELADLSPMLGEIVQKVQAYGIKSLKDLSIRMVEVIPLILPYTPSIAAKTLGISEDEVRAWPINKATMILLTIMNQNLEYLKNCFGLAKMAASPKEMDN